MLQYVWHSTTITTNKQANDMITLFKTIQPKIGAFDTETDGLHILLNKPFLFQFGFLHPEKPEGYTFAVDLERQPILAKAVISIWHKLAHQLEIYLGHNVKYDLHMITNIGLKYSCENLSDTMFYIRFAHDNLRPSEGGPPLALKDYAVRYIDATAKTHEKLLDKERSSIAKELNLKLKQRLRSCGTPPQKYNAKSYTIGVIEEIFKDALTDIEDLPEEIKPIYLEWLQQDIPIYLQSQVHGLVSSDQIPYNTLNRTNIIKYAHYDIIYTLELYLKTEKVIKTRENSIGLQIENSTILPIFEMERVGFYVNVPYIAECRLKLKEYILKQRKLLADITGVTFTIGQHAVVKSILCNTFNVQATSTNSDELDLLKSNLIISNPDHPAVEMITVLQELRTLEKWYSVYVLRFLNNLKHTDRLYTMINQVGAVSGRVTSDFQQFPKDAIRTTEGEELFNPRKMVQPSGGDYSAIIYLDYSQIELRFQAFYTLLVGDGDINLCRAYMPYKCVDSAGNLFDYNNCIHIQNWNADWYLEEDTTKKWTPVDVHGATTEKATGLTDADPTFKKLRSVIGKRVNFAKNYGAQYGRIRQMFPEKTEAEVRKIDAAYYEAFPGVKQYHSYCYDRACYSYTTNLFGVRYYNVSGHKLINMLIQGSAAYYLKIKIKALSDYFKKHNYKSRFQMEIHDELSWEYHNDDPPELWFVVKAIMEDWSDTIVPIVAEMEMTKTTWSNKKGVDNLNELQVYLSS